jgi:hypothetical protein
MRHPVKLRPSALPLVVATLAGGLLLTACGGASSTDSASAAGTPTGGAVATESTPEASSGTAGSGTSAATSAPASAAGAQGGATPPSGSTGGAPTRAASGSGSGACHTANLSFSYGPDSGAQSVGSPGAINIKMTNKGSATCSMKGYPGLDLVGGGITWSLDRQTAYQPHTVSVKPGGSTSFTFTYMPYGSSGKQMDVKTIVITPPNETHSVDMTWDYQPVKYEDDFHYPNPTAGVGPVGR